MKANGSYMLHQSLWDPDSVQLLCSKFSYSSNSVIRVAQNKILTDLQLQMNFTPCKIKIYIL